MILSWPAKAVMAEIPLPKATGYESATSFESKRQPPPVKRKKSTASIKGELDL
ncbi:hypothetical protein LguiA_035322 [Lonicera macranthoides]